MGFGGGFLEDREANGMRVSDHHSEQQLQRLADQEPRADLAKRLRAVLLAKQGYTAPEIATCTGFSRRVVQTWMARYNRVGLAGLETKPGRGRKPPLTAEEADQLKQRLDAGPLPEDGVCTLRGQDVRRILEREFGQLRSLNAVYGLLHRLGYSSLAPRPRHPQADSAVQDEFKKNSATGLPRSKRSIPAAGCKSSTKTKRGSASKGR
jgi:transposase